MKKFALILLLIPGCAQQKIDQFVQGCLYGSSYTYQMVTRKDWQLEWDQSTIQGCGQLKDHYEKNARHEQQNDTMI